VSRIFGDVIGGLVMFEVVRSNTGHLPDQDRGGDRPGISSFLPDEERRPARMSAIGARLGVPPETARRYALRLVEQGFCQRHRNGLVAPAEVLASSSFIGLMTLNHTNLTRMYGSLSRAGVIEAWDSMPGCDHADGINLLRQLAAPGLIRPQNG
jgi:hypothetical protein